MKSVIYVFIGVTMFALHNVIVEQKLAKFGTLPLMLYFYTSVVPIVFFSLCYMKLSNRPVVSPTDASAITLAIFCGVLYFFGDVFYVGAFTSGGNVMTISTVIMMFPVVASGIKYAWVRELPGKYQIIGYVFAAVSILFIIKGNMQEQ